MKGPGWWETSCNLRQRSRSTHGGDRVLSFSKSHCIHVVGFHVQLLEKGSSLDLQVGDRHVQVFDPIQDPWPNQIHRIKNLEARRSFCRWKWWG